MRGLAALAVLVFHAWLYTRAAPSASARGSLGDYVLHELRLGLVLFFVLSGLLLWRPWVAAALGQKPAPRVRRYLVRRGARLLPAYYLALAGTVLLLWDAAGTPGVRLPRADELPLFMVFAQNYADGPLMSLDPPMWTLVVEVSFYLLLVPIGLLAVRLPARYPIQATVPLALLAFGVGWNVGIAGSGSIVAGKALPAMLPYFAVGMLAALLLEARELGGRLSLALGIAGVLLVLADATWQAVGAASHSGAYAYRIWRDLPAAAGFAALLALAATNTGPLASLLRWRPLVALGTISYGLYLWHVPVLLFARHNDLLPLHTLPAAALALVVAGALAAFSWRWVEQPALARAHAVTIRRRSWPTERPEPHPHHAG